MKVSASLTLIAIGAVLKFAVTKQFSGITISTVGVILMVVGALGFVTCLVSMFTRRRTDVVYGQHGVSYYEPGRQVDRYPTDRY